MARDLRSVSEWARDTRIDGERVIDKSWVQQSLARVHAKIQALRLMNWKQAWAAEKGQPQMADSSAIKVYGSEFQIEAYRTLMEIVSVASILSKKSPGAALQGRLESSYRNGLILTFGGGTNEIQRDIIAMAGMGMPNYKD
jgi:alkylation response protein AidB-like acyl-CoA dehydrogenase